MSMTNLAVGDSVDVPGGMYGTVRFIGAVEGKTGVFAGVELAPDFAARGKNDGDVDGISYFTTARPGAGIFLPLSKAHRRQTESPRFSQSVGQARASSPVARTKRPSLPRPESPLRRAQPQVARSRQSLISPPPRASIGPGTTPSRYAPSPTPSKLRSSVRAEPRRVSAVTPRTARKPPRAESRSESRLGPEPLFDEDSELSTLKAQLKERDRQLERYAADLESMQKSVAELQVSSSRRPDDDLGSLRALIKEKNDKITALTSDFDAHRADFRDTIDILEHTSDETNRHYEERIAALETELQTQASHDEDVESVAQQLVLLEKQVEDLEEGLEDSRRGETEARAEVEHLRGEVERTKAENLARKGSDGGLLAQRDDEINSLKAVIHSMSREASLRTASPRPAKADDKLEARNRELERIVEDKKYHERLLEEELDRLRRQLAQPVRDNDERSTMTEDSALWCDMCEAPGHDILHCSSMTSPKKSEVATPRANADGMVAGKESGRVDGSKWCALCERDGHESVDCPMEEY